MVQSAVEREAGAELGGALVRDVCVCQLERFEDSIPTQRVADVARAPILQKTAAISSCTLESRHDRRFHSGEASWQQVDKIEPAPISRDSAPVSPKLSNSNNLWRRARAACQQARATSLYRSLSHSKSHLNGVLAEVQRPEGGVLLDAGRQSSTPFRTDSVEPETQLLQRAIVEEHLTEHRGPWIGDPVEAQVE